MFNRDPGNQRVCSGSSLGVRHPFRGTIEPDTQSPDNRVPEADLIDLRPGPETGFGLETEFINESPHVALGTNVFRRQPDWRRPLTGSQSR